MQNINNKKKHNDNLQEFFLIDEHLKDLEIEATALFKLLDRTSDTIRRLESCLQKLNANFPFSFLVQEEKESPPKKPESYHKDSSPREVAFYTTQTRWYLFWKENTISKNYRLFLISEEFEYIYFQSGDDLEHYASSQFKVNSSFQEPFISTKLHIRLRYSEFLISFIDAFKNYLRECRQAIEQGEEIPF